MPFRLVCLIRAALCLAPSLLPAAPGHACLADGLALARTDSTACLTCHDDALAPGYGTAPDRGGTRADHPVRVSYRESYARSPGSLRQPEAVERLLTLPAGKVECVTCHQPDPAGGWTVVSTGPGRRLCGECHRQ